MRCIRIDSNSELLNKIHEINDEAFPEEERMSVEEMFTFDSDRQFILDFEEVMESAENYEQRLSRKNFYLRNGFHETGYFTVLCGERYEVVCTGSELDETALYPIMNAIHKHTPEFESRLR